MAKADSAQTDVLTLFKPRKLSPALMSSGHSQLSLHNQSSQKGSSCSLAPPSPNPSSSCGYISNTSSEPLTKVLGDFYIQCVPPFSLLISTLTHFSVKAFFWISKTHSFLAVFRLVIYYYYHYCQCGGHECEGPMPALESWFSPFTVGSEIQGQV